MGAPNCPFESAAGTYLSNIIYPLGGPGNYVILYNANVVSGFTSVSSIFLRGTPTGTYVEALATGPFGESLVNSPVVGSVTLPQTFTFSGAGGASGFTMTVSSFDTNPTLPGAGVHVTFGAQTAPSDTSDIAGMASVCDGVINAGPPPVNLASAEFFTILSESGITNTGAFPLTTIHGNIGTSPITGAAITGISCNNLVADVDGASVYTVDGLFVPASGPNTCQITNAPLLTAAVLDMMAAYTDALSRTPDLTNPYSSDLGNAPGGIIPPGVYKFTGALGMTQNVSLSGPAGATWIFQVAGAFTVAAGKSMLLAGGATAENVIFAVISAAPGVGAHVEGNILASTAITLSTGASVDGKLLAQTAVTLLSNIITNP